MNDRQKKIIVVGGAAAALAAAIFLGRRKIMDAASIIGNATRKAIFDHVIPVPARSYSDVILRVAKEQQVDPFWIVALGMRESRWGEAIGGPGGTGDAGHGRGIMQIDDRSQAQWLASNDWTDPYVNVTKGAQILKEKAAFFLKDGSGKGVELDAAAAAKRGVGAGSYRDPRPLSGDDLIQASIAAYNSGEGNVLKSIAAGVPPDTTTAGGNYSSDVLGRIASMSNAFVNAGGTTA